MARTTTEQEPFWLQREIIKEFVDMTPTETEAHIEFENLAYQTIQEMLQQGAFENSFSSRPQSSAFGLHAIHRCANVSIPDECLERWMRFEQLYPVLVARNPRLELRDMMQDMSEEQDGSSWPYMYEWAIEKWIAEGASGKPPYSMTPSQRDRLKVLHPQLRGWLYYDDHQRRIVFAELHEFRLVKTRRDAARAEATEMAKGRYEEALRRMEERLKSGQPGLRVMPRKREQS